MSAISPAEWFARTLFKMSLYTVLFLPLPGASKWKKKLKHGLIIRAKKRVFFPFSQSVFNYRQLQLSFDKITSNIFHYISACGTERAHSIKRKNLISYLDLLKKNAKNWTTICKAISSFDLVQKYCFCIYIYDIKSFLVKRQNKTTTAKTEK